MSPAPLPAPPAVSGFAPRAVGFQEAGSLLRETWKLVFLSPGRLIGLYLAIYLPVQLVSGMALVVMPLRSALVSIGFAGYYLALEAAYRGRPPGLSDLAGLVRMPRGLWALLALAGLFSVLAVWGLWWLDMGTAQLRELLTAPLAAAADPARAAEAVMTVSNPPLAQKIEAVAMENLIDIPLLFLQPLCVLRSWSATRTLSANLIASLANWRWALVLAVALGAAGFALYDWQPQGLGSTFLLLAADVAIGIVSNAFTLVLMHRALG
jgi:hypothetical protein